jgi:dTDP-4-amino-4,6-dideoxygalactose transaminase
MPVVRGLVGCERERSRPSDDLPLIADNSRLAPSQIVPASTSAEIIPVFRPLLPRAEQLIPYLQRIDETRLYSNYGPLSIELERRLAGVLALQQGGVVCTSSGTAALVGAVLATAGRATAERPLAIVPAFTFAATAAAAEQCGYQPYLADVDFDSWMLDPERLVDSEKLEKFGVVIPVAPLGRPVPLDPWARFRAITGIPVVIDGAASFAALTERPQEFVGAIPVAISFHATKAFATGEGGAVATSDLNLRSRIWQALNFGIGGTRDTRTAGFNGKMSEYHAAVGLAELDGWRAKLAAFCSVAAHYRCALAAIGLADRFFGAPDIGPNYALFQCPATALVDRVEDCLRRAAIDFRRWYGEGMHRQSYYRGVPRDALPVTESLAVSLLGLPVAPDLDREAIGRVVGALAEGLNSIDR